MASGLVCHVPSKVLVEMLAKGRAVRMRLLDASIVIVVSSGSTDAFQEINVEYTFHEIVLPENRNGLHHLAAYNGARLDALA
jgi:hypothetical protein